MAGTRYLLTVDDTFEITGRGTVVAPAVDLGPGGAAELAIELRRPDGTRERCTAKAQVPMFDPPQLDRVQNHVLVIPLAKSAVPVGTEVWLVSDAF